MTKTLTKFTLLLVTVCALFSGTAHASYLDNFYLQIVNTDTGSGAVIQVTGGSMMRNFNLDGGVSGNFFVVFTEEDTGGIPAQTTMAMLANVNASSAAHIQITL